MWYDVGSPKLPKETNIFKQERHWATEVLKSWGLKQGASIRVADQTDILLMKNLWCVQRSKPCSIMLFTSLIFQYSKNKLKRLPACDLHIQWAPAPLSQGIRDFLARKQVRWRPCCCWIFKTPFPVLWLNSIHLHSPAEVEKKLNQINNKHKLTCIKTWYSQHSMWKVTWALVQCNSEEEVQEAENGKTWVHVFSSSRMGCKVSTLRTVLLLLLLTVFSCFAVVLMSLTDFQCLQLSAVIQLSICRCDCCSPTFTKISQCAQMLNGSCLPHSFMPARHV